MPGGVSGTPGGGTPSRGDTPLAHDYGHNQDSAMAALYKVKSRLCSGLTGHDTDEGSDPDFRVRVSQVTHYLPLSNMLEREQQSLMGTVTLVYTNFCFPK